LQKLIAEHNAVIKNLEELFAELLKCAQNLNEEERRGVGTVLMEEELILFGILTKPKPTFTKAQKAEVKRVTKAQLGILKKKKLVLDWRARQQSRAAIRQFIEVELDRLSEVYTPDIFETKCDLAYRHMFDHYVGPSESLYHPV
jgi:type I restriction enzyme R subunit